uniref:C2H2-type domain-containing protein n=1 Tax=Octopus bimaculoides TaxID=37653 RepID=A0A0L8I246_OCTBM
MVKTGTHQFEDEQTRLHEEKWRQLKERQQNLRQAHLRRIPICSSQCNRTCVSRIGLFSHERACQHHQRQHCHLSRWTALSK